MFEKYQVSDTILDWISLEFVYIFPFINVYFINFRYVIKLQSRKDK